MKTIILFSFCLLGMAGLQAQVDARLFQFPDVSQTQITFVYGDDIWVAPKEGGIASRLSSPEGLESFPAFRPTAPGSPFPATTTGMSIFTSCPPRVDCPPG